MESNNGGDFVWGGWLKPYQYILGEMTEATIDKDRISRKIAAIVNDFADALFCGMGDHCDLPYMQSYSGRGMYGKSCLGVSVGRYDMHSLLKEFKRKGIPEPSKDTLGMGAILYWQNIPHDPKIHINHHVKEEVEVTEDLGDSRMGGVNFYKQRTEPYQGLPDETIIGCYRGDKKIAEIWQEREDPKNHKKVTGYTVYPPTKGPSLKSFGTMPLDKPRYPSVNAAFAAARKFVVGLKEETEEIGGSILEGSYVHTVKELQDAIKMSSKEIVRLQAKQRQLAKRYHSMPQSQFQAEMGKISAAILEMEDNMAYAMDQLDFIKSMKKEEVAAEAYAPLDTKGIVGAFTEATKKKRFEYRNSTDSWGKSHGLPHEVCVSYGGDRKEQWRSANVKGTVCYIAVDEGADGKPVMEKWAIRNHVKYVKAESVEFTEAAAPAAPTHGYKIGDILFGSTYYGMIIPHFYKVTRLIGATKIEVVELTLQQNGDGWSGQATPSSTPKSAPKVFTVKKSMTFGSNDPGIKINNYLTAKKWDGKPEMYNYMD